MKTNDVKPTDAKVEKPTTLTAQRVQLLTPLIQTGKYTQKQLIEMALPKFPGQEVGLQTLLTDSKNPKYNRFAKLVVKDKDGLLSFKK